jgi:ribonuclease P protein component
VSALPNPDAGGLHPSAPGSLRFPHSSRLLKHAAFERVYRQGRRVFSGNLTLFYLRREDTAGPRVGFTVSRALGGAVDRNRIKRRLREAVRLSLARLSGPWDVVINPKRSVLQLEFARLSSEIDRAFIAVQQRSSTGRQVPAERAN